VDRGHERHVIRYPRDRALHAEALEKDIPDPVLVRDIVRVVEVLNLLDKKFFGLRSVLAGSMALRCFGSPRFTVYDADFSTTSETVHPETAMQKLLQYRDRYLEITAAPPVPSAEEGTVWKSAPITYEPAFTALVPDQDDRTFKADVSHHRHARQPVAGRARPKPPIRGWRPRPAPAFTPGTRDGTAAATAHAGSRPAPAGGGEAARPRRPSKPGARHCR
jgi:hypothetical protein